MSIDVSHLIAKTTNLQGRWVRRGVPTSDIAALSASDADMLWHPYSSLGDNRGNSFSGRTRIGLAYLWPVSCSLGGPQSH